MFPIHEKINMPKLNVTLRPTKCSTVTETAKGHYPVGNTLYNHLVPLFFSLFVINIMIVGRLSSQSVNVVRIWQKWLHQWASPFAQIREAERIYCCGLQSDYKQKTIRLSLYELIRMTSSYCFTNFSSPDSVGQQNLLLPVDSNQIIPFGPWSIFPAQNGWSTKSTTTTWLAEK